MIIEYAKTLERSEDEITKWENRIIKINNKLCDEYYPARDDYSIVVGSVGRKTAITKTSDYDLIFKLPHSIYLKFDNYEGNGQSQLLQEIKNFIKELYPKMKIKGDGQVVSIEYSDGIIELVPSFEETDGSFKYPDSCDGGRWKKTNPLPEIKEAKARAKNSSDTFRHLCFLLRQWKNHIGFSFKGLLIDTFVANYLIEEDYRKKTSLELLEGLFLQLSKENKNQSYWYALGSNQKIYNNDNGKFVTKAKKALKKFQDANEYTILKDLFGYKQTEQKADNEEFIDSKFIVDIRFNLKIDCEVSQDGFRNMKLSDYIQRKFRLGHGKKLNFFVADSNIPSYLSVDYYWKVRNCGKEALGKERGEILVGSKNKVEYTSFNGKHYVECYAVYKGIVIGKDKIEVPIDILHGK